MSFYPCRVGGGKSEISITKVAEKLGSDPSFTLTASVSK